MIAADPGIIDVRSPRSLLKILDLKPSPAQAG
jgi:hypothetical protein